MASPTIYEVLSVLIAEWRDKATGNGSQWAAGDAIFNQCADELEARLAAQPDEVIGGTVIMTRVEWDRQTTQADKQALVKAKVHNAMNGIVEQLEQRGWGVVERAENITVKE